MSTTENITFRADSTHPRVSYALRLHRPGYHSLDELDSERLWLDALRGADIAAPHPVPTADGRYYVEVEVGASQEEVRLVGLSRWVEGNIVAEVLDGTDDPALPERCFGQLGSLMAAMHNQASGWVPPAGFVRHRLDADGLLGGAPFWGPFWDHPALTAPERELLIRTRDRLRSVLLRYGHNPRTFSMIHADLHLDNLLINDDQLGVIDFDDAGFGWHQYDIAVALFHSRGTANFATAEQAFFDAYRSVRSISDDDLALVPTFELIRGMALIGWIAQRPEVAWPHAHFDQLKNHVLERCKTTETEL